MKSNDKIKVSKLLALGVVLSSLTFVAHAQERKTPGERAVEYRQSLYQVLAGNFGPAESMASGKTPFDAAKAQKYSERAAYVAKMLDDAFPPNSNGVGDTYAKPEIWTDTAQFQKLWKAMVDNMQSFSDSVKGGDMALIKAAAEKTGESCKNCHEKFKRKRS